MMTIEQKLIFLSLGYLGVAVAALTVPRLLAQSQQGLAAAGTSAFWFLIIAFIASLVSVIALGTAIRAPTRAIPGYPHPALF